MLNTECSACIMHPGGPRYGRVGRDREDAVCGGWVRELCVVVCVWLKYSFRAHRGSSVTFALGA